jgi:L-fuconolactonase
VTTAQAVVDSHIHFWDTDRFDYPWLQGFSELNRPFVPADLDVGEVQIEALIFVQANPVWDAVDQETAWVQHLREGDRRIQALVAGLPLDRGADAVNASLERLSHESHSNAGTMRSSTGCMRMGVSREHVARHSRV